MADGPEKIARLVVLAGPHQGKRIFPLKELTVFEIGRAAGSHIRIRDKEAAPNHARIFRNEKTYTLYALSDKRPTCVNGEPVKKALLNHGDILKLGQTELRFELVDPQELLTPPQEPIARSEASPAAEAESQQAAAVSPQVERPEAPAPEAEERKAEAPDQKPVSAKFVVVAGDNAGSVFSLEGMSRCLIGRASHCDLRLPDLKVSREHCVVEVHKGHFVITDLESANGTVINGERVKKTVLQHNDYLRLGFTVLRFELVETTAPCPS